MAQRFPTLEDLEAHLVGIGYVQIGQSLWRAADRSMVVVLRDGNGWHYGKL